MGIIEAQKSGLTRDNFQNWINSVFGAGIAKYFMMPYNFKVWAHPLDMMSASWQGDRVPNVDVGRILENLLENRDDVSWDQTQVQVSLAGHWNALRSPRRGSAETGQPPGGGGIYRSVRKVGDVHERSLGRLRVPDQHHAAQGTGEEDHRLPGRGPRRDTGLASYRGYLCRIGVSDPCPSTKCWMYFPESDSPFYRVTYLSNYSAKMTPPGEHFSLLAEVSASRFKQENIEDVVDRTIKGMLSSKLLTPEQAESKIVSRQLLRVPYSYPVPTTGRDRALAAIHPWLTAQGIYSRGRFGAWRYEIGNTDHCVMQGVEIAEYLARGTPEYTWALLPGEESRARIA